jgi:methionyl-tRNA formyltransferase
MRVVTLGSGGHPLTAMALEVVRNLPEIDHVGHVESVAGRNSLLNDPNSPESLARLTTLRPDVVLSAAYTRVLREEALAIPSIGAINVHPSLLPDYRGSHPIPWALFDRQEKVGITIHEMTLPVDSGPILAQESLDIDPEEAPQGVYSRLCPIGARLLRNVLMDIQRAGRLEGRPQSGAGFYRSVPWKEWQRLELDFSLSGPELARRSRIFPGHVNFPDGERRLFVRAIEVTGRTRIEPGQIVRRRFSKVVVAAGDGTLVTLLLHRPLRSRIKHTRLGSLAVRVRNAVRDQLPLPKALFFRR